MNLQGLKSTYKSIFDTYPSLENLDEWVGFSIQRTNFEQGGELVYVKAAPGNATEYRFHLIIQHDAEIPGIPDGLMLLALRPGGYSSWKRTMFLRSFDTHPSYISEKLEMNDADAVALSVILQRVGDGLS